MYFKQGSLSLNRAKKTGKFICYMLRLFLQQITVYDRTARLSWARYVK